MTTETEGHVPHARVARLVFPDQTNHHGTLFGGEALSLMTAAATHAAARRARKPVVLASSERIDFKAPILEGSIAEADARVVAIGRTSMTISVELHGEAVPGGERVKSTEGRMVFVAIGSDGRPAQIEESEPANLSLPGTWTTERIQPGQANHHGYLLGGELMRLLDTIAFITATRKARQPLVTAALRELAIEADVRTGDLVYIGGRVTKAGDRSLTVRTELTLETERSGASRTTSGEFVMVTV